MTRRTPGRPERRNHRHEWGDQRHFVSLILVRRIDQHETLDALRMIRREEAHAEPAARCADEHQRAGSAAAIEQFTQLAGDPSGRRGDGPGSL